MVKLAAYQPFTTAEEALENMNEYIKNNIPKKVSELIIKKCNETGCYLFLFKLEKLEEF
jgi:hypothetical protein